PVSDRIDPTGSPACMPLTARTRTVSRGGWMPRLTLAGNTTVVTGAASGMGAEIARQLDAAGAHLALLDHNAPALAAIAEELKGTVTTHVVDLRDDDAVAATASEVTAAHPR